MFVHVTEGQASASKDIKWTFCECTILETKLNLKHLVESEFLTEFRIHKT